MTIPEVWKPRILVIYRAVRRRGWVVVAMLIIFDVLRSCAPIAASKDFTAVDVITIVLSAATLAVTALGIGLALAAFFGYTEIRSRVEQIARSVAGDVARETATAVAGREARAAAQIGDTASDEDLTSALQDGDKTNDH